MANIFEIPLEIGTPQRCSVAIAQVQYQFTLRYLNVDEGGWILDIADGTGSPIVDGVPLVTGCDLLGQYKHLGFKFGLWVQTINDPDAVPTFENLGNSGKLYAVTP